MAVGTGEAVNEAPFFDGWIPWQQRMDRLVEGTRLIRRLWKSKSFFDFKGRYFPMTRTVLYTRPKTPLNIYFSAFGAKSAHYAGEYGDGIVTSVSGDVDKSIQQCREVIFSSFDEGARKVRRDPATMARVVGVYFTFQGERAYLASARKYAGMFSSQSVDERDPRRLESLGESVSDEDLLNAVFLCSSWSDMTEVLSKLEEAGATEVYLMLGANKRLIGASARKLLGFRRLNAP
jgi:coenzyme F420-dependent glucose-6-phosphate dehydrogenase